LLVFAKYLSLYLHIFTCTYRGTHTQAHMYYQHTRGMATTRHSSLVERGGREALLETLHTSKKKCPKKPIFTNLKKRLEHIELSAKLLTHFLRSNKSNVNQSKEKPKTHVHTKTREFQTHLLHYFFKSDNKSNHHHDIWARDANEESCSAKERKKKRNGFKLDLGKALY